jgi:transposase-like protein
MDPTTVCCPNRNCPARGQTGQGNIGIHARKEQRFICHACDKTFSTTTGPVFSRLHTSVATVVMVVTFLAHGCPVPAMVAACGFDERTVAAWWARSGRQGQAVHESLVEPPRDLGQVQADELRVKQQGGMVWMAMALLVQTRRGLGGEVSAPRDLPLIRRLLQRGRCGAAHRPLLVCPDGWVSYIRAVRETLRDPIPTGQGGRPRLRPWRHVWIAQVVKRYERRRVVDPERRIGEGTPARVEPLRRRSQGGGVLNTADMERLHATVRARLAPRARRCRARARHTMTLHEGMCLVGTGDNFCTPHESVSPTQQTTPAMAAGITRTIAGRCTHCCHVMCRCLAGHHRSGVDVLLGLCKASSSDGARDHGSLWSHRECQTHGGFC